jgi:hypothetical protein
MSDKSWNEVIERDRRKVAAVDDRPSPVAAVDDKAALPGLDDPYKAVAHLSNGPEEALCVILGHKALAERKQVYRFFQYVHLDSDTGLSLDKDGHVIKLRFAGVKPVTVTVRGRNLLRACHLMHKHRIAWIRLFDPDRGFPFLDSESGKKTEIITAIDITPWRPGEE